ncbi:MAG: leucine-rich repeat protein, partial [Treponemataceae bacterium]|nr:leucine-rich repeat protein [Treponemataceae bacterium]
MKKTATLIAVCLAAACALALVTGCVNDISFVEVESVALNAPTLTLSPGGTGKLSATVMPEDAGDKTVAWSSSDKGVATVGNDGTVTAVAEGAATITARAGGKTAACAVTVCVHSYSGSNCTKCGFPNPSPADDDVPPKTDDNVQGGEEPSKTDGNVQEGGEPPKPDGEKTESTPTALLTIVNNSSYVLYDVKWNGTAVSYGGEISTEGTQSAPVFSGKACIYFSFYPKSGDGIKIGCHTDSDIGIASGGAASFTFTDDTIVVQPNFETNRNSLSTIHPYGLVIENGVVVKCDVDTVGTAIIPDGVTRIKSKAFYGCSALTSIIIPDSVTYIGDSAFSGCSGVKNVYYNGDVADWCRIEFDTYSSNPLYYNNENLYIKDKLVTEFIIPDSVTSIRNYAFYGCSSLTSVTIPDSVTSIG